MEREYTALEHVLERLYLDPRRCEFFILLLSMICLDRTFILQVLKCSGRQLLFVAQ